MHTIERQWSWRKLGAFWDSPWGLMFGSAMMLIPGVGHVMFAGLARRLPSGCACRAGIAAVGGALASFGVSNDTVNDSESAPKAGSFLVLPHTSEQEVNGAKEILVEIPVARVDSSSSEHKNSGCH